MVLMTVEPGMLTRFRADPIGRMFNVVEMPSMCFISRRQKRCG